ncbi:MAG TPA: DsbA family protein [Candidatus Dojkabacteria bacterium]|jgi:protein-disulfide isomerase
MAKKETKSTSDSDVITIDIQPFLTPISIIIGAIIISVSLLIGLNGVDGVSSSSNTANSDTATDGTTDTAEEFPSATVSIDDDPIKGDKNKAKVAIVEFSDYECPFCKRHFQQTYDQLMETYVDSGDAIMVFRDFPLSFHDPLATKQAMAAECVQDLASDSKYYEYHDLLFTNTSSNGNGLAESKLFDFAEQIGVNRGSFTDCYESEKFAEEVKKDLADGTSAGVSGTPGFIVGKLNGDGTVEGKLIAGAYPFSAFEEIIKEYL